MFVPSVPPRKTEKPTFHIGFSEFETDSKLQKPMPWSNDDEKNDDEDKKTESKDDKVTVLKIPGITGNNPGSLIRKSGSRGRAE